MGLGWGWGGGPGFDDPGERADRCVNPMADFRDDCVVRGRGAADQEGQDSKLAFLYLSAQFIQLSLAPHLAPGLSERREVLVEGVDLAQELVLVHVPKDKCHLVTARPV